MAYKYIDRSFYAKFLINSVVICNCQVYMNCKAVIFFTVNSLDFSSGSGICHSGNYQCPMIVGTLLLFCHICFVNCQNITWQYVYHHCIKSKKNMSLTTFFKIKYSFATLLSYLKIFFRWQLGTLVWVFWLLSELWWGISVTNKILRQPLSIWWWKQLRWKLYWDSELQPQSLSN